METAIKLLILGISTVVAYDIAQSVRSFGYTFDKFKVTTEDGYILEIHRISESPNGIMTDKRPPVLVMHGLLGCSADFIHIGPGKSLPLRLADEGYDVWLGNNRGNTYSQKHSSTTIKNASFWDFSFHEIGLKDTPAVIDFILDKTGEDTLSYVAHSTGVAQLLITTVMKPEYQKKVKIVAALAPVVYLDHAPSLLLQIVNKDNYAVILAAEEAVKATVILDHNSLIWDVGLGLICGNGMKFQELCADLLFILTGFDTDELDRSDITKFFSSFPAGISVKELNHILQWKLNGLFSQYDYGMIKNEQIYNSIKPPIYDLSNMTVPVALFYGKNDLISTYADIQHLASDLPKIVESHVIEYDRFNHIDFLLAKDVDSLLNFHVINTLNVYNDKDNITKQTTDSATSTTQIPPTTQASSSNIVPVGFAVLGIVSLCIKTIL
ncbi:unnamed protein product [Diabrotica balteata]|uniref:Lipase n=1 Tax=Diabrotica balteata TaxID=107213 RepID=A0A9N9X4F8_DIABA|nr:unnamed protein product [Diabrotica balteata]